LTALTGAPIEVHYHEIFSETSTLDELWGIIQSADRRNFVITTAVQGRAVGKTKVLAETTGLQDAHAYSVISVHQVQTSKGEVRLLKVRNPWSEVEWKGDWSDNSYLWTEALKQELGLESKDDGIFFISFADYASFFYMTTICKY
jgi:calpain-15